MAMPVLFKTAAGDGTQKEKYYAFREGEDGYDTQEWIGKQEWCNGNIGMAGSSYGGTVQWRSAPYRSQYLKCITPRVICTDYYSGLVHPGGAFQLNVMMTWGMRTNARTAQTIEFHNWTEAFRALPLIEMDERAGRNLNFWKDWVEHPAYDDYWEQFNDETKWGEISVPAFNMGGWYDLYAAQTFTNFNGLRLHGRTEEAKKSKLIVGPWPHSLSLSPKLATLTLARRQWSIWKALNSAGSTTGSKVWTTALRMNPLCSSSSWGSTSGATNANGPLARTQWQKWHLHSDGSANTLLGNGALATASPEDEPPDHYTYDPRYPTPTMGGNNCCSPHIVPWGPYDQRPVEMRSDVLCSPATPLKQLWEVTGPIKAVIYAATDCTDTDWTAKLVDVSPTGYAMNLCDGILRARFRESLTNPTPLTPGSVYAYEIDLGVTGNVFKKGHRIRLEISSSNFPRFDRNLNTGGSLGRDTEMRQAHQTVYHSKAYPSHITLPVIPSA